ncbi:MAG TPA: leucyl/phenylalanyl-tRNA--protein transferase [Burkholderiales bacterium]
MLAWLGPDDPFPPVERALREPNGLLAAGGELSPARLLQAYRCGIFPWYSTPEPILWWSPDPRMVLYCEDLKVSRSLGKSLRNKEYEVRIDTCFSEILQSCADPRKGEKGTWLGEEMQAAYLALHHQGHAHSFETWRDGRLVGGLYGVAVGRLFCGESMFSREADASKVALVHLVRHLQERGCPLVDCQVHTELLASLGAREIPRRSYLRDLAALVNYAEPPGKWSRVAP